VGNCVAGVDGGLLVTMWNPTAGMKNAAQTAGTFTDAVGNTYPRVQIMTVEDLLAGKRPQLPIIIPPYTDALPVAEIVEQGELF